MVGLDIYEVRTDVKVGDETIPHVVATELREDRAVKVANRERVAHQRPYYVVKISTEIVHTAK